MQDENLELDLSEIGVNSSIKQQFLSILEIDFIRLAPRLLPHSNLQTQFFFAMPTDLGR